MSHDFLELPLDPEEAFLLLEDRFRRECDDAISRANEHDNISVYYTDYIAQVLGAAEELGLVEAAFETEVPRIEDVDFHTYQNFSKRVKHYRTRLEIRHGRRVQMNSVSFDGPTKLKIHHLLGQVRDIFTNLALGEQKKEALFARLKDLEAEVDRNRTRFEAYAALAIEAAEITGDIIERSKVLDLFDAIARIFGIAKKEESTKQLPGPTKPKQIEHQSKQGTQAKGRSRKSDLDDEIPF